MGSQRAGHKIPVFFLLFYQAPLHESPLPRLALGKAGKKQQPFPTILTILFPFPPTFPIPAYATRGKGLWRLLTVGSVHFSSVAQLCLTLHDPMNHSTPGLPVHHQLLEFTQTHVHWVGDAIQPSHPLSSPSPPALNLSQHQGLFKWVNSLHQMVKVLEFQLQHQSFQWTPSTDLLSDGLVGSPCSPRDSQEASPTPQFKSNNYIE